MRSSKTYLGIVAGAAIVALAILATCLADKRNVMKPPGSPPELVARESLLIWRGPENGDKGSDSRADASFVLVNVGSEDVRIFGVDSGCGCTKPTVNPAVVRPGSTARVEFEAIVPLVGSKDVRLNVRTDSMAKPVVPLTLRLVSPRKAPYLFELRGDLAFRGEYRPDIGREFKLLSLERPETSEQPVVQTLLTGVQIDYLGMVEEPARDFEAVLRTRTYRLNLTGPPAGSLLGEVVATAPWDEDARLTCRITGDFREGRGLIVSPSLLRLGAGGTRVGRVIVRNSEPFESPEVALVHSADLPLSLRRDANVAPRRLHVLTVDLGEVDLNSHHRAELKVRRQGESEWVVVSIEVSPDQGGGESPR